MEPLKGVDTSSPQDYIKTQDHVRPVVSRINPLHMIVIYDSSVVL